MHFLELLVSIATQILVDNRRYILVDHDHLDLGPKSGRYTSQSYLAIWYMRYHHFSAKGMCFDLVPKFGRSTTWTTTFFPLMINLLQLFVAQWSVYKVVHIRPSYNEQHVTVQLIVLYLEMM